jgi:hypothetical protein
MYLSGNRYVQFDFTIYGTISLFTCSFCWKILSTNYNKLFYCVCLITAESWSKNLIYLNDSIFNESIAKLFPYKNALLIIDTTNPSIPFVYIH